MRHHFAGTFQPQLGKKTLDILRVSFRLQDLAGEGKQVSVKSHSPVRHLRRRARARQQKQIGTLKVKQADRKIDILLDKAGELKEYDQLKEEFIKKS